LHESGETFSSRLRIGIPHPHWGGQCGEWPIRAGSRPAFGPQACPEDYSAGRGCLAAEGEGGRLGNEGSGSQPEVRPLTGLFSEIWIAPNPPRGRLPDDRLAPGDREVCPGSPPLFGPQPPGDHPPSPSQS
jgi:hypothetical protein